MCGGSKPAPSPPPAPAPAAPLAPPEAPRIDEKLASADSSLTSARQGRNSLRIDLAQATPGGGSGLSIPV